MSEFLSVPAAQNKFSAPSGERPATIRFRERSYRMKAYEPCGEQRYKYGQCHKPRGLGTGPACNDINMDGLRTIEHSVLIVNENYNNGC